jgi:hypothetical protein
VFVVWTKRSSQFSPLGPHAARIRLGARQRTLLFLRSLNSVLNSIGPGIAQDYLHARGYDVKLTGLSLRGVVSTIAHTSALNNVNSTCTAQRSPNEHDEI